jgi:hypothetical protein
VLAKWLLALVNKLLALAKWLLALAKWMLALANWLLALAKRDIFGRILCIVLANCAGKPVLAAGKISPAELHPPLREPSKFRHS